VWLSSQSWFELHHLWYVSVATVALQAGVAWAMLSVELDHKLANRPSAALSVTTG